MLVNPRLVAVVRWIARIWTALVTLIILLIVVLPDPYAVEPVPVGDWILLGILYGTALLGLWLAWRWEGIGGAIAIASLPAHFVAFRIIRGVWPLSFGTLVIRAILFVLPGVLFLLCWFLSRGKDRSKSPEQ
jgi:hypothetical protein